MLIKCKDCGSYISKTAMSFPHCGKVYKKSVFDEFMEGMFRLIGIICIVLLIGLVVALCG